MLGDLSCLQRRHGQEEARGEYTREDSEPPLCQCLARGIERESEVNGRTGMTNEGDLPQVWARAAISVP